MGGRGPAGRVAGLAVIAGSDLRRHWDGRYARRGPREVSWFEESPEMSLAMIDALDVDPAGAVVDVGGGASGLAGALLARGFTDVTVVDVSEVALQAARERLGEDASRIAWRRADILEWTPDRPLELWHDRAVLHFLTDPVPRERYIASVRSAVRPGGGLVIGTFAEDGPVSCSGLPVARYDAGALAALFAPGFAPIATRRHEHRTPDGALQAFTWVSLRRV